MIRLFEPHSSCLTTTTYRDLFRIHTRLVKSFAWDASDIVDTQVVRSRPPISAQADARVFSSPGMCRCWQILKYIYTCQRSTLADANIQLISHSNIGTLPASSEERCPGKLADNASRQDVQILCSYLPMWPYQDCPRQLLFSGSIHTTRLS